MGVGQCRQNGEQSWASRSGVMIKRKGRWRFSLIMGISGLSNIKDCTEGESWRIKEFECLTSLDVKKKRD